MQDTLKKTRRRYCALLICILFITACSGPIVLGTIYNGAPKRVTKALKGYAKFTKPQKQTIDHRFAQYHQWHRNTQLPIYSGLLREVALQLETETGITDANITQWVNQAGELSLAIRYCSPLNRSNDFWATLTESQIKQIKQKTADVHALRVEKYDSETAKERSARRHKEILTWAKRAGLKFNSLQSDLLRDTISKQKSLGGQRLLLWQKWSDQFNNLLANQNTPEFTESMNKHIKALWTLTKSNYPDEWQASKELWTVFLQQFMTLQTAKQNQALLSKTFTIAESLEKISKDSKTSVAPQCFNELG